MARPWYSIADVESIDSPSLLVYKDRVAHNIQKMIEIAGDLKRLRPHVKTHKMAEVASMHVEQGITKFKCATIAEAEMLAESGAQKILLAHQPVGPKLYRYIALAKAYPQVAFETLVDDKDFLKRVSEACIGSKVQLGIWVDLDNGMARSGIGPGEQARELYAMIDSLEGVEAKGLHVYDGHFRADDFAKRKEDSDLAFQEVYAFQQELEAQGSAVLHIVAGGSPTFPVHALRKHVELSPGTYVFWDAGYGLKFKEMTFQHAALVLTRIISKPGKNRLTLDLGHKSIAPENPIDKRVVLLDLPDATFVGHSEEHLVIETDYANDWKVGDVLFGLPWHICPTVALHQKAHIIQEGNKVAEWKVIARDRQLAF